MKPNDPIDSHFRLTPAHRGALKRLRLETIHDLLYHFPARHIDPGKAQAGSEAEDGERVTVYGQVEKTGTRKSFRGKIPMGEATIRDQSSRIALVWFNQPYLAKMIAEGDVIRASGTAKRRGKQLTLVNPEVEKVKAMPTDLGPSLFAGASTEILADEFPLLPVYPETQGITSRWFFHAIRKALASGVLDAMSDPIPEEILTRYHLPPLRVALVHVHTPRDERHATAARKRFAFEEVFLIQLERQKARRAYAQNPTFTITPDPEEERAFRSRLGFRLTKAQENAAKAILHDLASSRPMLRLLEGDVGSGKTAVAALAAHAVVIQGVRDSVADRRIRLEDEAPQSGSDGAVRDSTAPRPAKAATMSSTEYAGRLQVAYMCPTEILATQQFEGFIKNFIGTEIEVGLITGSGCRKFPSKVDPSASTPVSRAQFLKWVGSGATPIVVGTHALVQKSVKFKHLALAIIDEQHRFGTKQRAALVQKDGRVPHILSMTATPIPRTLALTLYGDLDLTLLDAMPPGRKPVKTEVVPSQKRREVEEHIRLLLKEGRQAYVICPRIDEPDPEKEQALNAKSVAEEAKRLAEKVFPEFRVAAIHGKMKPKEKDATMAAFASGEVRILVATSVIEVGVNVPNATIIVIEGAERFGLAQLHQLRGRVIRGTHQPYCYLYAESNGEKARERLRAMTTAPNGFALAEMDLALRGAGELSGAKQWGISDIGMEAIKNLRMVEAARHEAGALLDRDPTLAEHPIIEGALAARTAALHFE